MMKRAQTFNDKTQNLSRDTGGPAFFGAAPIVTEEKAKKILDAQSKDMVPQVGLKPTLDNKPNMGR